MSREIKFRAWDTKTKTMTICRDLYNWLNAYAQFEYETRSNQTDKIKQFIFLQYTGLNDKNGKEIYEGDICKSDEGNIQEVVWKNNSWMYKLKVVKSYQGESYVETIYNTMRGTSDKRFGDEVISNIYEAKDLLEEVENERA